MTKLCVFPVQSSPLNRSCVTVQFAGIQYMDRLCVSQLLSEIMLQKYVSTWQPGGSGLSCTGGVLAVRGDFVLSGWVPGVKRGHTSQLPRVPAQPAAWHDKCWKKKPVVKVSRNSATFFLKAGPSITPQHHYRYVLAGSETHTCS